MNLLQEILLREYTQPSKREIERRWHLSELKRMEQKRPLSQKLAQLFTPLTQLRYIRVQISFDPPTPCVDCPVQA